MNEVTAAAVLGHVVQGHRRSAIEPRPPASVKCGSSVAVQAPAASLLFVAPVMFPSGKMIVWHLRLKFSELESTGTAPNVIPSSAEVKTCSARSELSWVLCAVHVPPRNTVPVVRSMPKPKGR